MYFLQSRPSSFYHHPTQVLHPLFRRRLANNPEDRMKSCGGTSRYQACAQAKADHCDSDVHVVEEEEHFLILVDVPGVNVEDLKVELTSEGVLFVHGERQQGRFSISLDRQVAIDEQRMDPSRITASLQYGTLIICVPKIKDTNPRRVAVVAGAPNDDGNDDRLSFELELPGVKLEALRVQVNWDGKIVIAGGRKRGEQTTTIHRAFSLNAHVVDIDRVEAFLEDGVLTIRAPKREPRVGCVIPVCSSTSSTRKKLETLEEDSGAAKSDPTALETN